MKNCILISLPGNQQLTGVLASKLNMQVGDIEMRDFPDGESYIRINSNVQNKIVILICNLVHPNNKILPLMFIAKTLKELGAKKICLITPYLPYMRQDKRFKSGEAITSILFASLISNWVNFLITIDPHLHRITNLSDIYSIDSISVLHSTKLIAEWICNNVDSPFIIGPDEESRQWVDEVAKLVSAPYAIIEKTRYGDREVSISMPDIREKDKTPILLDDIISTGTSMLVVTQQLLTQGFNSPVCICVHALFDEKTVNNLLNAGVQKIVTCNTIHNTFGQIDIAYLIVEEILRLKFD